MARTRRLQRAEAPRKIAKKSRSGDRAGTLPPLARETRTRARRTPRAVPRRCGASAPARRRSRRRAGSRRRRSRPARAPRRTRGTRTRGASPPRAWRSSRAHRGPPRPARTRAAPWRADREEAARVRERQGQQHEQEHRRRQQGRCEDDVGPGGDRRQGVDDAVVDEERDQDRRARDEPGPAQYGGSSAHQDDDLEAFQKRVFAGCSSSEVSTSGVTTAWMVGVNRCSSPSTSVNSSASGTRAS